MKDFEFRVLNFRYARLETYSRIYGKIFMRMKFDARHGSLLRLVLTNIKYDFKFAENI